MVPMIWVVGSQLNNGGAHEGATRRVCERESDLQPESQDHLQQLTGRLAKDVESGGCRGGEDDDD